MEKTTVDMNDVLSYCQKHISSFQDFTEFQKTTISNPEYWNQNTNLFITAPTSSGKTLLAFLHLIKRNPDGSYPRTIYMVPYRALAYQKQEELRTFLPEELGSQIVVSTSECQEADTEILNGSAQFVIIIYEKVFLFQNINPDFIRQYDLLIMDEFSITDNFERGVKVEYILQTALTERVRCIILTCPFYDWSLYENTGDFVTFSYTERPVRLYDSLLIRYKSFPENGYRIVSGEPQIPLKLDVRRDEMVCQICAEHYRRNHITIVFINSRQRVRELTQKIYAWFLDEGLISEPSPEEVDDRYAELLNKLQMDNSDLYGLYSSNKTDSESKAALAEELKKALCRGIAFHNAGMPYALRAEFERVFLEENGIKIMAATSTLAYGINSGADAVVIADILKPDEGNSVFLTNNEYYNYIGRAGRLGRKNVGFTYTLVNENHLALWQDIISQNGGLLQSWMYAAQMSSDRLSLYILSFFHTQQSETSWDDLSKRLAWFPHLPDRSEGFQERLLESLQLLEDNSLIARRGVRGNLWQLTDFGRAVRGYTVNLSVCLQIKKSVDLYRQRKHILLFDFFFSILHSPDFYGNWSFIAETSNDKAIGSICEFLLAEGPGWVKDRYMSKELLSKINSLFYYSQSAGCTLLKQKNTHFPKPFEAFTIVRESVIMTMFALGYDAEDINIAGRTTLGVSVRLMGEVGYLVDLATSLMEAKAESPDDPLCEKLRCISRSLALGGIPLKVVEVIGSRQLHASEKGIYKLIFQYADILSRNEKGGFQDQLRLLKLKSRIETLNDRQRDILLKVLELYQIK